MSEARKRAGPAAAPVEEDPNAPVLCSSPPCFMHELDPSYLGYLSREETRALLDALLAAGWDGAAPDESRLRAALRGHLEALGGRCPDRDPDMTRDAPRCGPDRLATMVRQALPRIHSDALRRDLEAALDTLGRGAPCRKGRRDPG